MHKVNKIDHICIAVRNLEQARKIWEPVMGKTGPDDAYVDDIARINVARYWLGDVGFELMEPTTPDSEVGKFLERQGEGFYLIGFNVDRTRESVDELKQKDYKFISEPIPFRDCEYTFIHPRQMSGVLLELIDYKWKEDEHG
jgi:methylmalonyl-CoA/ethylmalonyl-CoA epimerase